MSAVEGSHTPIIRPSDYLLDINKVLLTMADNELLLNSSELSGGLYEGFPSQEETLRVGCHSSTELAKSHLTSQTFGNKSKILFCTYMYL